MTPSDNGRIALIFPGVLPNIFLASCPTATTVFWPLLSRIATTDGSFKTIPTSLVYMRVFAVPRSIDKSLENKPRTVLNRLKSTMIFLVNSF